jgi:hypothetical protein
VTNPVCFAAVLGIENGSRPDLVTFPIADGAISFHCTTTAHRAISGMFSIGPVGSAPGAYVLYLVNDVFPEMGIESVIPSIANLNAGAGICQK